MPAFRIKKDVLPGRYTETWFEADKTGVYHLFCAEFCGTDHAHMGGRVVVMEPRAFEAWLQTQNGNLSLAADGAKLFRQFGCSGCHEPGGTVRAPQLEGLYGRPVPLEGGGTVIADERYIRDSILTPRAQVVAGYAPVMPSFAGQIGEDDLVRLIAYIKSLANAPPPR
jgi:cytochrome c oxidase subunit 2